MATTHINRIVENLRHAALAHSGADPSDSQLLDSFIVRRDEYAFEMLVRRHGPMVLGVCRRVLGNHHDADDAFQATFLVLVRKAATVKPRELVGNWLYGVAYQTAVRARALAVKRHLRETAMNPIPETAEPAGELWRDLQPLLDKELARLGEKYRVPIVLCDLEGRTRKEAADQIGVPEGTINSRLARGRTMLADRLTRQGVTLSAGALATLLTQQAASASLPTALVLATVKMGGAFAVGGSASAKVAVLAEAVLKAMLIAKLKIASAVVLVVLGAMTAGYFAVAADRGPSGDQPLAHAADPAEVVLKRKRDAEAKSDRELIQGIWKVVKTDHNGKALPNEHAVGDDQIWHIGDGKISIRYADGETKEIAFRLDPAAKPKAVDVTIEDEAGAAYLGIYDLDGDKLQFAYSRGAKARPADFSKLEFIEDRGRRYFLLQRDKAPIPKTRTKEEAAKLLEQFKANADAFELTIDRRTLGTSKADLRYITLHSSNRKFEPSVIGPSGQPIFKNARITREQAVKIIELVDGFPLAMFRFGKDASKPPQADESSLYFQISYGPDDKPGPALYRTESYGWHTLVLLSSLSQDIDGEAGKIVGELLKAIEDDPNAKARDALKRERTQLTGTWRLVGMEADGEKAADRQIDDVLRAKLKWVFDMEGRKRPAPVIQPRLQLFLAFDEDGKWRQYTDGEPAFTFMNCDGTCDLEPGKKPKTIDLTVTRSRNNHKVDNEGEQKGKIKRAIYDTIDDTLRICWGEPGKDRPTEFSAKFESYRIIWVLERVRKAPDERLLGSWTATSVKGEIKKADWVARADGLTFLKPDKVRRVDIPATVSIEGKDGRVMTLEYAVHAGMKPPGIDFVPGIEGGPKLHGIYQIDGDSVRICLSDVGVDRPKDFEIAAGDQRVLLVLRRPILPDWFHKLDTDGDGQVALYEWRRGGKPLDEFREWDLNNDGFISPDEAIKHQATLVGKTELQKLEGTWLPASGEQEGAMLADADLKAAVSKLVFTLSPQFPGNTLTWHKGNEAGEKQKFKVSPGAVPKQIEFNVSRKGIYEVDGDTLKVCIHYPFRGAGDKEFPKSLDGKGKYLLLVFKHAKDAKKEPKGTSLIPSAARRDNDVAFRGSEAGYFDWLLAVPLDIAAIRAR